MDNQHPLTPEGFRTAAYLAARERLDARKTSRNVQCNPPNVRCGNRCIPPTWDCRLKGQGADPHLRAVKTDPLGGLANIQRGFGRISKGIVKGNFSEVEGGKRAVIRGTVKIAPGNIQQKKELQKKLEDRTRAIGIGLAVVTGGLGVHALLMRSSTRYRQGPGLAINNATRSGIGRVMDAVPILGAQRAQNRTAVTENVAASIERVSQARAVNPAALTANDIPRITSIASEDYDSHGKLQSVLKAVNDQARSRESGNLTNWDERHRTTFWNATRADDGLGADAPKRISIFARPSAEEFLASQFGVASGAGGDRSSLKAAIAAHLAEERGNLVRLAKQQGFRVRSEPGGRGESIDSRDLNRFVAGVMRGASTPDSATRRGVAEHLNRVLTKAPTTYTDELYRDTVLGFDTFYKQNGYNVRQIPGAASNVAENPRMAPGRRLSEGTSDLLRGVDNYRSAFLAREMNIRTEIASPAHAELIRTAYYHTRVVGSVNSTFSISDRIAFSVASDLAGRAVTSRSEAIQLLNREPGFQGARLVERPATRAIGRRRSGTSEGEAAYQLMRQNPGMTLEAAKREVKRRRGDADHSPELVRTAAYLAARADFKENPRLGKPCGASHIPKAHECRKGRGSAAPDSTKLKVAAVIGGAVVAGGLLAAIGVNRSKVSVYRSHVSDSAIKAETLAKIMMDEMRQNASTRLGKDLKDINGFEASVYNFKDSGHDRGFGSNDKESHYFGQTPNSRGAVVMLSYADDNRFTRQGQGSYKMVKSGAFQEIWGEHDILPFANSISQPSRRSPDDITLNARDRVVKAAGPLGKGVKNAVETKEALANFEYLQENINRRGHNPDAVRAAAFVVAQRRLTGKPVHLMSYSNGGNVASETLAILKEMGYRDVKVVNVAGPTFGVFKHGRDQMRTWVSRGDEFWAMGRNAAFQGSNVQFLRNSNIPHGLTAKTDPNNRENGANWKANFKAKNSYLLDEQLQQEAYRFLTVDSRRSQELADEFIWRAAKNKPMEGDLDTILGVRGASMTTAYTQRRRRNQTQADEWLRTEIEKHMIDKWYGGYNAKTVKNRQKQIQRDLQEQIHGKKADT